MSEPARYRADEFHGLDLNTPPEVLRAHFFQRDQNGQRRRAKTWRPRPGYSRFFSGETELVLSADASDDFNRADAGTLGANWTNRGSSSPLVVNGNRCGAGGSFSQYAASEYNAVAFTGDHGSQVKVVTVSSSSGERPILPIVRCQAGGAYSLEINSTNTTLFLRRITSFTGATFVTLASLSAPSFPGLAVNDVVKLAVLGSLLEGYVNGVRLLTAVDTVLTGGRPGLLSAPGAINLPWYVDDWAGGTISTAITLVQVSGRAQDLVAYERDDGALKVILAAGQKLQSFDTGTPEGF